MIAVIVENMVVEVIVVTAGTTIPDPPAEYAALYRRVQELEEQLAATKVSAP